MGPLIDSNRCISVTCALLFLKTPWPYITVPVIWLCSTNLQPRVCVTLGWFCSAKLQPRVCVTLGWFWSANLQPRVCITLGQGLGKEGAPSLLFSSLRSLRFRSFLGGRSSCLTNKCSFVRKS